MAKNLPETMQRRGHTVYETNPSITNKLPMRIAQSKPSKMGDAMMIAPGTGEVLSKGTFGFVREKVVDTEEFVKMYLAGIRTYGQLRKAGSTMFEYVYEAMSGLKSKDKDTFEVNLTMAQRWRPSLGRHAYFKGMKELLDREFIYRTMATDVYFVNVRFMFNGDRIVLAQSYRRKPISNPQKELPLLDDDEEKY